MKNTQLATFMQSLQDKAVSYNLQLLQEKKDLELKLASQKELKLSSIASVFSDIKDLEGLVTKDHELLTVDSSNMSIFELEVNKKFQNSLKKFLHISVVVNDSLGHVDYVLTYPSIGTSITFQTKQQLLDKLVDILHTIIVPLATVNK